MAQTTSVYICYIFMAIISNNNARYLQGRLVKSDMVTCFWYLSHPASSCIVIYYCIVIFLMHHVPSVIHCYEHNIWSIRAYRKYSYEVCHPQGSSHFLMTREEGVLYAITFNFKYIINCYVVLDNGLQRTYVIILYVWLYFFFTTMCQSGVRHLKCMAFQLFHFYSPPLGIELLLNTANAIKGHVCNIADIEVAN